VTLEVNAQPVAEGETYETETREKVVVEAPGLLANDTDPDGPDEELTVSLAEGLRGRTGDFRLTLRPDGSFEYEPPGSSLRGTAETFVYEVVDAQDGTDRATVQIEVKQVGPDRPTYSSLAGTEGLPDLQVESAPGRAVLKWAAGGIEPAQARKLEVQVRRKNPASGKFAPAEAEVEVSSGKASPEAQASSEASSGGPSGEPQARFRTEVTDLEPGIHELEVALAGPEGRALTTERVEVKVPMEEALRLIGPSPNPVRQSAAISFAVKESAEVKLVLYNVLGQRVRTLYEGTPQAGRQQTARVDTEGLPSGTYFLRLTADGQTRTRRVTVVR
jgi:hypothetical protein